MCYDQEKTQTADPRRAREFEVPLAEKLIRAERVTGNTGGQTDRVMSDSEILSELFKYHPPTGETLPKFSAINQAAKNFAEIVLQNCPRSADRSAAIRLIRDARMTANAAVALNGLSL